MADTLSKLTPVLMNPKAPHHAREMANRTLLELQVFNLSNPVDKETDQAIEVLKSNAKRRAEEAQSVAKEKMRKEGPDKWHDLHHRARDHKGDDMPYLNTLAAWITCGECRQHFRQYLAAQPPRFQDTHFDYFAWTVNLHNSVNEKLGKPVISLTDAVDIYYKDF